MIVSNTSPIIFLSKIEKIDLLHKYFGTITLPEAVLREIKNKAPSPEMRYFESRQSLFRITTPKKQLALELGAGESAAISLSIEQKARILLIDDHQGRLAAEKASIEIIGTLGILLLFLEKKEISFEEFKNLLNILIESGFRIGIEVYQRVLNKAEKCG